MSVVSVWKPSATKTIAAEFEKLFFLLTQKKHRKKRKKVRYFGTFNIRNYDLKVADAEGFEMVPPLARRSQQTQSYALFCKQSFRNTCESEREYYTAIPVNIFLGSDIYKKMSKYEILDVPRKIKHLLYYLRDRSVLIFSKSLRCWRRKFRHAFTAFQTPINRSRKRPDHDITHPTPTTQEQLLQHDEDVGIAWNTSPLWGLMAVLVVAVKRFSADARIMDLKHKWEVTGRRRRRQGRTANAVGKAVHWRRGYH